MGLLGRITNFSRNLFSRRKLDHDLDEELQSYVDLAADAKHDRGLSTEDARRAALVELGGAEQVKKEIRGARAGQLFLELLQDLRYGFRTLRHNLSFTLTAVCVLALGIGANATIFSVAYGILGRPLPYADADRVAVVYMHYFPRDFEFGTLCIRDFLTWRDNDRSFEQPSLFHTARMDLGGTEAVPQQVRGASVTAGFFPTLGVQPLLGRTFAPGEDKAGSTSLTVLSEAIWRSRYASSPSVIGRAVTVNGTSSTVIGVMPASFQFPRRDIEVWVNLPLNPPTRYGPWFYRGVARLKPGVTLAQAQQEINNIAPIMMREYPYYKKLTLPILSLRDSLLGSSRPAILILAATVGMVLLIALVNVANLMMARATVREREMALRLSLGAGRGRLIRQLLTESTLLAMAGGAAGLALAWVGIHLIRVSNPGNLPLVESVQLDGVVVAFTVFVSMAAGILFGLAPALTCARTDLNATIQESGRTGASSSRSTGRLRAALVIAEITVSLMLLIGAGLLLRSFVNLQRVTGGFSAPPSRILSVLISPGNRKYNDPATGIAFYNQVLERARHVQGVESAVLTDSLPPDRQGDADTFSLEGQTLPPGEINAIISSPTIGPGFFHTFGIPIIQGREFDAHDNLKSRPVAIVSEGFVKRYFPDGNGIGKRIRQSDVNWMEIVGVVGNVKYLGLTADTDSAYYKPFLQNFDPRMALVVRTSVDAASLGETLRNEIQSIDPGVTLAQIGTMEQTLALSVSQPRFDTMLLGLFAAIAMLLAAVGIYGLIAYSVVQRTHEIGVRVALGAARSDVVRGVVRQGAVLAGIGIAFGLAGSLALSRLLENLLFGVGATDWLTFAAAPLGILFVVLLATLVPALRASRISPVEALRYQ
ncbi:MAG TPA: ABC transporter permease [Bryobacteraceae bacterium]|jgi:putative ABC transport system permease protein